MSDPDKNSLPHNSPGGSEEDLREAALVFGLYYAERYREAGYPYGRTVEAMLRWMEHECRARSN